MTKYRKAFIGTHKKMRGMSRLELMTREHTLAATKVITMLSKLENTLRNTTAGQLTTETINEH
jgi:hypothetical protein